jgi:hypothetical protein
MCTFLFSVFDFAFTCLRERPTVLRRCREEIEEQMIKLEIVTSTCEKKHQMAFRGKVEALVWSKLTLRGTCTCKTNQKKKIEWKSCADLHLGSRSRVQNALLFFLTKKKIEWKS